MGDENHGLAGLEPDVFHLRAHSRPHVGIECRKRFIHQDDFGIDGERARYGDTLAFSAGEHGRIFACVAGKADEVQQLARVRLALSGFAAAETKLKAEHDIFERGAPRHQPWRLKHESDFLPGVAGSTPIDRDAPAIRSEQSADDWSEVDLPQPDGPRMQTNSPRLISKLNLS